MASILNATTSSGLVTSADNSGSLQLQTNNGTTAVTIDTSQNVGIGTSSPNTRVQSTVGSNGSGVVNALRLQNVGTSVGDGAKILFTAGTSTNGAGISSTGVALDSADLRFETGGSNERMRIDSSGNLLVVGNSLSSLGTTNKGFFVRADGGQEVYMQVASNGTASRAVGYFYNGNGLVGSITTSGSATAYNTSSDYRLKENIAPMQNALGVVAQLKPVTYNWKVDGSTGQGFIAHELAEVVPDCVTGEKDAVETYTDEEGNEQTRPVYQGVDTSFLVATLTAAIQELKAELDATKAEVQALKGVA